LDISQTELMGKFVFRFVKIWIQQMRVVHSMTWIPVDLTLTKYTKTVQGVCFSITCYGLMRLHIHI
jgi:hypothetical protein